jgi:hypothetical protein
MCPWRSAGIGGEGGRPRRGAPLGCTRGAEARRWKVEIVDCDDTGIGGVKAITGLIEGRLPRLSKSGVHRAAGPRHGRFGPIHVGGYVAVLPAEDVDVKVEEKDIRVDRFCARPGGQASTRLFRRAADPSPRAWPCSARTSAARSRTRQGDVGLVALGFSRWREKVEGAIAAERKKLVGPRPPRRSKIQLPAVPHHRPPHRLHHAPPGRRPQGNLDELIEPPAPPPAERRSSINRQSSSNEIENFRGDWRAERPLPQSFSLRFNLQSFRLKRVPGRGALARGCRRGDPWDAWLLRTRWREKPAPSTRGRRSRAPRGDVPGAWGGG